MKLVIRTNLGNNRYSEISHSIQCKSNQENKWNIWHSSESAKFIVEWSRIVEWNYLCDAFTTSNSTTLYLSKNLTHEKEGRSKLGISIHKATKCRSWNQWNWTPDIVLWANEYDCYKIRLCLFPYHCRHSSQRQIYRKIQELRTQIVFY